MERRDFILKEIYFLLILFFKNLKRINGEKINEEEMARAYINMIYNLPIDNLISYRDYLAKSTEISIINFKNEEIDEILAKNLKVLDYIKWFRR